MIEYNINCINFTQLRFGLANHRISAQQKGLIVSGKLTRAIMFKDLQLKWTTHPDNKYSGRRYLDFIVSGQSLRDYLGIKNKSSVTLFGFFPIREEQIKALKEFRLQQKPQLPGNRIELYVCENCGDIGCGAVTAKIIDRGDRIVWTEFAKQSDQGEIGERIGAEEIEFERQNYFKAFSTN